MSLASQYIKDSFKVSRARHYEMSVCEWGPCRLDKMRGIVCKIALGKIYDIIPYERLKKFNFELTKSLLDITSDDLFFVHACLDQMSNDNFWKKEMEKRSILNAQSLKQG